MLTKEQKAYVLENYRGVGHIEMSRRLGVPRNVVKSFYHNHHLNSGLTVRFVKGQIPPNKGKRQEEYMSPEAIERSKATRFKKGDKPHNHRPVGSFSYQRCWLVKVAEPNVWECLSRHEYRRFYGEIPEGMLVCHLNGDENDMRRENLTLMTMSENARINTRFGKKDDPDRTRAMLALLKLEDTIREKDDEEQSSDAE